MSERTLEEYLESIGLLEELEDHVKTASIARILEVTPASVSEMLQRLSEKGLVIYKPYKGVNLTDEGKQLVLGLSRRHRLWEVFLHRCLGISWDLIFDEACALEHTTSVLVTEKLAGYLGNPTVCPHGLPIPDENLVVVNPPGILLTQIETGSRVTVTGVTNESDSEYIRYLSDIGLVPGKTLTVLEISSFDGILTLKIGNETKAISKEAAGYIMVDTLE